MSAPATEHEEIEQEREGHTNDTSITNYRLKCCRNTIYTQPLQMRCDNLTGVANGSGAALSRAQEVEIDMDEFL